VTRPAVTVIVPFAGSEAELANLLERLEGLELRPGDQIIVADNRADNHRVPQNPNNVEVVSANAIPTPAFARNQAATRAAGEWLVFIDADTVPEPALLDAYFRPAPKSATGVLAGSVDDLAEQSTLTARHAVARGRMSQETTLRQTSRPYAQTANCAVRRVAFEEIGGFAEAARAAEDADLCFRLQERGWALEARPDARVIHVSRSTPGQLIRQLMCHGSGAEWVNRRHPGTLPAPTAGELVKRLAHSLREVLTSAAQGEREHAGFALLDLVGTCAFELGRRRTNLRRRLPSADAG